VSSVFTELTQTQIISSSSSISEEPLQKINLGQNLISRILDHVQGGIKEADESEIAEMLQVNYQDYLMLKRYNE